MAKDVRERFLDDAVHGQVDRKRDRSRLTDDEHRGLDAGAARALCERLQLADATRRLGRLLVVPELPEHGADVMEHVTAGRPDRLQRLERLFRPRVGQMRGDTRLHGDRGESERDDVVQLAGKPQPLALDETISLVNCDRIGSNELERLGLVQQRRHSRPYPPFLTPLNRVLHEVDDHGWAFRRLRGQRPDPPSRPQDNRPSC